MFNAPFEECSTHVPHPYSLYVSAGVCLCLYRMEESEYVRHVVESVIAPLRWHISSLIFFLFGYTLNCFWIFWISWIALPVKQPTSRQTTSGEHSAVYSSYTYSQELGKANTKSQNSSCSTDCCRCGFVPVVWTLVLVAALVLLEEVTTVTV